jgi:adiponectin receptor
MRTERDLYSLSRRRPDKLPYRASVLSIASLHTETLNIWSHLLGALWFSTSIVRFAIVHQGPLTRDAVGVSLYLVATALCFASSTLYHVFADHVHAWFWLRIDHVGIVCAIWATSVSFTLASLECRQGERWTYTALVTAAAGLSLFLLARIQEHDARSRKDRLSAHVAFGAVAAIPGLRCWYLHAQGQRVELLEEFWSLVIGNGVGGGIYATHLLDKAIGRDLGLPDISHHVMHIIAVAGAWMYQQGLLAVYEARIAANRPWLCL